MKKYYLILSLMFVGLSLNAQDKDATQLGSLFVQFIQPTEQEVEENQRLGKLIPLEDGILATLFDRGILAISGSSTEADSQVPIQRRGAFSLAVEQGFNQYIQLITTKNTLSLEMYDVETAQLITKVTQGWPDDNDDQGYKTLGATMITELLNSL